MKIKDQEGSQAASQCKSQNRIGRHIDLQEINPKTMEAINPRLPANPSIPSMRLKELMITMMVNMSEQQAEGFEQFMNAHKAMHAPDLNITLVNDQESSQHLANKFLNGRYDQYHLSTKGRRSQKQAARKY